MIEAALAGDQDALAGLLNEYRDRLRRMVSIRIDGRARGRFSPSDVVQEAFIEVARRITAGTVDHNIPFFLWLRLVTGDQLAGLHRKHLGAEKRDASREVDWHQTGMPAASSVHLASQLAGQFTSVDRGLRQEEVRERLEQILNSMSADDREIIAMRHFEELTTEDIATVLNLTRSGALKRYTRAIRRLSKELGE